MKAILFSPPMVRAILDGRKTQTRRIIDHPRLFTIDDLSPQPFPVYVGVGAEIPWGQRTAPNNTSRLHPKYQTGDLLWVRERWCNRVDDDDRFVYNADGNLDASCFWHEATNPDVVAVNGDGFQRFRKDGSAASPWKPGIHMPREACRLWLKVEAVRVERLQDITEADARAEGVDPIAATPGVRPTYIVGFAAVWMLIHGVGSWDANPWVWVYTFSRAEKPEGWPAC